MTNEFSLLDLYCISRLQAEVEEVLEGRTEVTNEDLEKLQYTEQVRKSCTGSTKTCRFTAGMLTAAVIRFVCKLAIGS